MNKNVWLFPQNSCDIDQFFNTLTTLQQLNGINRKDGVQEAIMKKQIKDGVYNPYGKHSSGYDMSSANHKIDEPRFYGAIYETPNGKIQMSNYGQLLLKYKDNIIKRNKIFLSMFSNVQFINPYKELKDLNIRPLRLIFKLLLESRLEFKLTNIEIAHILYYVDTVKTVENYNNIVDEILLFRSLDNSKVISILDGDAAQFIKSYVSCNYLFNFLKDLEIVNHQKSKSGFKLKSPLRKAPTNICFRTISLKKEYVNYMKMFIEDNDVYEDIKIPLGLRSEWIVEIYNTVYDKLFVEIGDQDDEYANYMLIPKLLVETSKDSTQWGTFEDCITKCFNFFDDLRAEKIGGPSEPDSLCVYENEKEKCVFVADGKSRNKKLSEVNDGRLKQHRQKYNAEYTIVVTSGYSPSAIEDIKGTKTCIITAYCFSDLVTKFIFKEYKNKKECSYKDINDIVKSNLGTDISDKVYTFIDTKIGIEKNIMLSK